MYLLSLIWATIWVLGYWETKCPVVVWHSLTAHRPVYIVVPRGVGSRLLGGEGAHVRGLGVT